MNSKNIIAISKEKENCVCMKCLKENASRFIVIPELGYGSGFDMTSTKMQLCEDCYKESIKNHNLWELNLVTIDEERGLEEYEYEDEIFEFVKSLPIEGVELFGNRFERGCMSHPIEPQDWIDLMLGELPHEKCKEYGFISPDEKRAYQEKFPTCQYPVNVIYEDESKGSRCTVNDSVFGDYGQEPEINICTDCYKCPYYKKRETPIQDINDEDFDDLAIYTKSTVKNLEEKFGK